MASSKGSRSLDRFAAQTDAELIAGCRGGDARAWEAVVMRYRRLVYAIPTRCGLPPEEADEVFQNTFSRLFERLDSLREPSLLRAWLVTTARRLSLDAAGRRKPVGASEEVLGQISDPAPLAPEEIERLEERQRVREAFQQLPERCRALLDLLYYATDVPSYDRVSERLKMPVGSIGPTRARCLEKLARLFAERAAREGE
jgi:RNA polymerase sigma factor (sigma-70 family)